MGRGAATTATASGAATALRAVGTAPAGDADVARPPTATTTSSISSTTSDTAAHCEARSNSLLRHVTHGSDEQSLEQMLDTLELAALYAWLGRNGEEEQAAPSPDPYSSSQQ